MSPSGRASTRTFATTFQTTNADGPFTTSGSKRTAGLETKSSSSVGKSHPWTAARSDNNPFSRPIRAPDNITPFKKMTYASSKQAMRNSLQGVGAEIQANDRADLEYKTGVSHLSFSVSHIPYPIGFLR